MAYPGVALGEVVGDFVIFAEGAHFRLMQMISGYCGSSKPEQQRAGDQECVGFHNQYSITALPPQLGYAGFGEVFHSGENNRKFDPAPQGRYRCDFGQIGDEQPIAVSTCNRFLEGTTT